MLKESVWFFKTLSTVGLWISFKYLLIYNFHLFLKRLSIFAFVCWLFIIGFLCFTNFILYQFVYFCFVFSYWLIAVLCILLMLVLCFLHFLHRFPPILCLLAVLIMFWLFTCYKIVYSQVFNYFFLFDFWIPRL